MLLTKNHQRKFLPDIGEPIDQEWCDDSPNVAHGGADEDPEIPEGRELTEF